MLALFVPLLAACGGGTGDTGTAPTGAPSSGEATSAPIGEPTTSASTEPTTSAGAQPTTEAGGAMTEGATAGASGDVTKIAVEDGAQLRFGASGNPTEQALYQQGADRFNQLFPNVKLTFEPLQDYQTTMKAAMAGATAPDVFLLDGELMGQFAPEGLLLPLDEAMTTAGVQPSDYYEPLIQLYQQDGQTYALPKDFNPLVLFINNDLAQQAGVDPAGIKTWSDWTSAAQKMTQGEGPGKTYGMCLNQDVLRIGAEMFQNGNSIIENSQAVFNQANGVAAVNFWYDFKESGTGVLFKDIGKNWCGEAFAGKNTAMAVEGGWLVPFMSDPNNNPDNLKYTAIPLPIPDGGQEASWLFTNGFAANAKTQYPNAAAAAVLFLTSFANQKAVLSSGLASPSLKVLADDPFFQGDPIQQVLVEQGQNGRLADTLLGGPVKKGDVLKAINDGMDRIFLSDEPAQAVLDEVSQSVNQILQQ